MFLTDMHMSENIHPLRTGKVAIGLYALLKEHVHDTVANGGGVSALCVSK